MEINEDTQRKPTYITELSLAAIGVTLVLYVTTWYLAGDSTLVEQRLKVLDSMATMLGVIKIANIGRKAYGADRHADDIT